MDRMQSIDDLNFNDDLAFNEQADFQSTLDALAFVIPGHLPLAIGAQLTP